MNNMNVSMPFFVDYTLTNGPGRIFLTEDGEQPTDFYRPALEAIVGMHEKGRGPEALDELLASLVIPREQRVFPVVVKGYRKFLRQYAGTIHWFEPPLRDLPIVPVTVRIVPALGLLLEGRPHAIIPYFRKDPLTPERIELTNTLLHMALSSTWPGVVFAVLDVRRGKLHPISPGYLEKQTRLVRSTAACLSSLSGGSL